MFDDLITSSLSFNSIVRRLVCEHNFPLSAARVFARHYVRG